MSDQPASGRPDNVIPLRPRRASPCPICKKPSAHDYRPFCSKRCADIDLHRWLGEDYRIASEERGGEPSSGEYDGLEDR